MFVDEPGVADVQLDAVAQQLERTTSISLPMTCWVRASRSAGVILSLTR